MLTVAVEDVTGTLARNPELMWIGGSLLVVVLVIVLVALLARARSRPSTSREELVERAARAEAERDALRADNERLRDDNERMRDQLDRMRGDGTSRATATPGPKPQGT